MKFITGERVRMIKHADWKVDAVGTIVSTQPFQRVLPDNSTQWIYWIEFDIPQYDLTDEVNGDKEWNYNSSIVLERYLVALKDENT